MAISKNIKEKLRNIKLLAMDFDGIHTDGHVYVSQDGTEMVRCSRKDGLGLDMLKRAGIKACVISKETNQVVEKRCDKLGIPCYHSLGSGEDKLEVLKRICKEQDLKQEEVLYVGDDINDIPCMKWAGVSATVQDCHPAVAKKANIVTQSRGGDHAVREICEILLASMNISSDVF
jgi:N-acylneuraminate cytidylyltransferase